MNPNVREEINFTDTADQTIDSLQTNSWALKSDVTKQKTCTQTNSFNFLPIRTLFWICCDTIPSRTVSEIPLKLNNSLNIKEKQLNIKGSTHTRSR